MDSFGGPRAASAAEECPPFQINPRPISSSASVSLFPFHPAVWRTTHWVAPKSTWKCQAALDQPCLFPLPGVKRWTPTTCRGRWRVIRRCKKFDCSTGNFWYVYLENAMQCNGLLCPVARTNNEKQLLWLPNNAKFTLLPPLLQINETYQQPGRWHDVILTPAQRKANTEPSEHIMSFHLHGLTPSSVYEAIVQAKNRYGWNEVSISPIASMLGQKWLSLSQLWLDAGSQALTLASHWSVPDSIALPNE